jgi:hypothetical protein
MSVQTPLVSTTQRHVNSVSEMETKFSQEAIFFKQLLETL